MAGTHDPHNAIAERVSTAPPFSGGACLVGVEAVLVGSDLSSFFHGLNGVLRTNKSKHEKVYTV